MPLGAQTQPKDLPWAVAEFGAGDWGSRLPLLLIHGWESVTEHSLSETERTALKSRFLAATLTSLDQQESRQRVDLDKKKVSAPLSAVEVASAASALAKLEAKADEARRGLTVGADAPATLPLRSVWAPGRDKLPWPSADGPTLASWAQATYSVTGSFRDVDGYLLVTVRLYSDLEHSDLAQWEGRMAYDEAADRMAEAADHFREVLRGRPWAGISLTSSQTGARVNVGQNWHLLPWSTDDLDPGPVSMTFQGPGRKDEVRKLTLESGTRTSVAWDALQGAAEPLVLETVPPGAMLYLDSRYLGPSPQTVDRPLAVQRVRAQSPGWETASWEVGPATASPSLQTLKRPTKPRPVDDAKDAFYLTLAAFSASLTTSAFLGAWAGEQVDLANAYALNAGEPGGLRGFQVAVSRYQAVSTGYGTSIVLTSGLFVWMMFALGDYLATAQATLP